MFVTVLQAISTLVVSNKAMELSVRTSFLVITISVAVGPIILTDALACGPVKRLLSIKIF